MNPKLLPFLWGLASGLFVCFIFFPRTQTVLAPYQVENQECRVVLDQFKLFLDAQNNGNGNAGN